jgi:hypothetical protein
MQPVYTAISISGTVLFEVSFAVRDGDRTASRRRPYIVKVSRHGFRQLQGISETGNEGGIRVLD